VVLIPTICQYVSLAALAHSGVILHMQKAKGKGCRIEEIASGISRKPNALFLFIERVSKAVTGLED